MIKCCVVCGGEFEARTSGTLCSAKCKRQNQRQHELNRKNKDTGARASRLFTCDTCGGGFTHTKQGKRRFCSDTCYRHCANVTFYARHREEIRARRKSEYVENRERIRETAKQSYQRNIETRRESNRKRYQANPDYFKARGLKQSAKIAAERRALRELESKLVQLATEGIQL